MSPAEPKLIYWDNPWLRKKAELHTEITEEVKEFVKKILHMMTEGVLRTPTSIPIGLASTQVQSFYRLFIVCPYLGDESQERWGPPKVFINPKLSEPSDELEMLDEGCLSFPKLYLPVTRPSSITVEYQDIDGRSFKDRISGYYARQVMHENDHLNGVLFIDRISKNLRKRLKSDLDALKKHCSTL
ncbi:MAG: Peptide deformylase [Chlamydiae bacterium]|nr:Peptide deformylase [Chlamydiota bacterium]